MTFEEAFSRLMGHEGGYSNDPLDPGGETNWGISKRSYPNVDITNLTRAEAKVIYREDFWKAVNADNLPDGVAFQLFDFAVNSGVKTAIRHFQRVIEVADDGHWGPISQAAADKMNEIEMIMLLCAERLEYMTWLYNWPHASRGWARRIVANLRYGVLDS